MAGILEDLPEQGPPTPSFGDIRDPYAAELEDPKTLERLFRLTQTEVGGQGPELDTSVHGDAFQPCPCSRHHSFADDE